MVKTVAGGQLDLDQQARVSIAGADLALVNGDGTLRLWIRPKPTPPLSRLRSASTRKNGLNRLVEAFFRNARTVVANGDDRMIRAYGAE